MFDISTITTENVNTPDIIGHLPLYLTLFDKNNLQNVITLLNLGASIQTPIYENQLPAQLAWEYGNRDAYRAILHHAQQKNILHTIQPILLLSDLHLAVIFQSPTTLKNILSNPPSKSNVNSGDICNATPLHHAASLGCINSIKLLLDFGADIDAQDSKGRTPLYITAGEGRFSATEFLISRGANVYINRLDGNTVIGCAVSNGHAEVLRAVIEKMVSDGKYHPDSVQCSCGFCAIHHSPNVNVAKVLVETGSDVNFVRGGKTALMEAVEKKKYEMVLWYLDNGADVNKLGDYRIGPIYCAIRVGAVKILRLLLEHDADIHITSMNILTYACVYFDYNTIETVDLLLSFNSKPIFSTFSTLLERKGGGRRDWFSKLFEFAENNDRSLAWSHAVLRSEEELCYHILERYVGFRTGWTQDVAPNVGVWKPRKPVEHLEQRVWNRHNRIIFRWITRVKDGLFNMFPPEVLLQIECFL
ncbi:hypothetical protein HK098_007203 [Nowakowskiella sp. JEL0407]|nr:hypothetical protein HK098_007203 [Nowakowskiella sp. JEL0407]